MKKTVFALVFCMLFITQTVYGLDFIVGAKLGYYAWEPFLKDYNAPVLKEIETGEGFLYGPIVSVSFLDDFTFSMAGLYGLQKAHWRFEQKWNPVDTRYEYGTYAIDMTRLDIDSALSYVFLKNMKVFIGYKYQQTNSKLKNSQFEVESLDDSQPVQGTQSNIDIEIYSHGPALGLGYSLAITGYLFAGANVSFLYMFGNIELKQKVRQYDGDGDISDIYFDLGKIIDSDTSHYGINFEPAIGIRAGSIIITIGGRYQWLRTKIYDPEGYLEDILSGWSNDHFYGAFVSVMYMF